jgi:hypothetical protein
VDEEVGDPERDPGGQRERRAERVEDPLHARDDEDEHAEQHANADRAHQKRVEHRGEHLALEPHHRVGELGQTLQHDLERARLLAGRDHRRVELVEDA